LLERQWGTLPELNFFEIARHFYASNNFQKKVMYLEETLRRAQVDNEPFLLKDSLDHLLSITVGFGGDGLIQHCFARGGSGRERSSQHLLQIISRSPFQDEPLLTRWLTVKSLQYGISLVEEVNQRHSEKVKTDPFAVIFKDKEIPLSPTNTSLALVTNQLPSSSNPTDSSKGITIRNVLTWVSQLALVQFRSASLTDTFLPSFILSLSHPSSSSSLPQIGQFQTRQQPRGPLSSRDRHSDAKAAHPQRFCDKCYVSIEVLLPGPSVSANLHP
jgi:hypothetical protein